MAKTDRPHENEAKGAVDSPVLALLANGSSGRWSVTLDESTEGAEEWFLQIEGPSLNLFCEVDDPAILHTLATVFKALTKKPDVLVIGRVNRITVRLQWDIEDDETLFFTVGPATRPIVRCSIHGPDIRDLAAATQQAAFDLK